MRYELTENEAKIIDWARKGSDPDEQPPTTYWGVYSGYLGSRYGQYCYSKEASDPIFEKNPREWFLLAVLLGGSTNHARKFRLSNVVSAMMPCIECSYNSIDRDTQIISGDFDGLYGIEDEETE